MGHRILVADDEAASRKGLRALLSTWGYEVEEAANGQEALEKAGAFRPAVVITDLVMPKVDGLGLLKALQGELAFVTVIILTGHGTIETAVAAVKQGAYDYLTKPVDVPRLRILIQKALEKGEAVREVALLRRRLKEVWGFGKLVGKSPAMQEVYRLIDLAAPTPASVLITGESGTGKELVAHTLHERSPRSTGPFVPVNCAAIPETLLESEIFGHEKGAFTGALERRVGCFELAHGGTIFLDEIAEMSSSTQAKFLRILQDGMVRRLGGKTELTVDVRVLAATNKDPLKAMKDGTLREDLYYRLNVFSLSLPPLRERGEDISLLIQAFIEEFNAKYEKRIKSVDDAALRALVGRPWPGNVRELRNTIERAVIACAADLITPQHLPPEPASQTPDESRDAVALPLGTTLEDAEKELILRTLASVNHNKTRAAEILGISLKTLHNKLHRYGA
ncbi:MAG: sigma-54-dependent Fis family transcriptional regulator [Deltaproteobacteria bacterium]|nr:sigma-54-dependent Fis family transcriptional regulator [Deltaproteobacteria bacterium]